MSKKMPVISGREMVKILEKKGFVAERKRGSHIIMTKGDVKFPIPDHKELTLGTLKNILNDANIERLEFINLVRKF